MMTVDSVMTCPSSSITGKSPPVFDTIVMYRKVSNLGRWKDGWDRTWDLGHEGWRLIAVSPHIDLLNLIWDTLLFELEPHLSD